MKIIKIYGKMPKWMLEYYYIPYTYEEIQRRIESLLIIFNKYFKLIKMIDEIFHLGKK